MYLVQRCDTLFLCTSARSKEGAGVANDRANLDCIAFTALYMATFSKPDVGNVYTMGRERQKSKADLVSSPLTQCNHRELGLKGEP